MIDDDLPLNKKNITAEITGVIDLDEQLGMMEDDYGESPAPDDDLPDENPLVDLVDAGLDIADDLLREAGMPVTKRDAWNRSGRRALAKALNYYAPPTSAVGGAVNTPAIALVIGLGCLALCFSPHIIALIKSRSEDKIAETTVHPPSDTEPEVQYEAPQTGMSATAPISHYELTPLERMTLEKTDGVTYGGF